MQSLLVVVAIAILAEEGTGTIRAPDAKTRAEVGNASEAALGRCTREGASASARNEHECINLGGAWRPAPSAGQQGGNGEEEPESQAKKNLSKSQPPATGPLPQLSPHAK